MGDLLAGYQSLVYYEPSPSVQAAAYGPVCACGRLAGDAAVCAVCMDQLDTALANVPALIEDLEIAQQRRATAARRPLPAGVRRDSEAILDGEFGDRMLCLPDEQVVSSGLVVAHVAGRMMRVLGRGRPDQASATHALHRLSVVLVRSITAITGGRLPRSLHGGDMRVLASWLRVRIARVALLPGGHDVVDDVTSVVNAGIALIDAAPELIDYGICRELVEGSGGELVECETRVQIPVDVRWWQCPRCGSRYDKAELEAAKIEAARGLVLPISDLAVLSGKSPESIRLLLKRRGIQPIGKARGIGREVALYRASDYLDAVGHATPRGA